MALTTEIQKLNNINSRIITHRQTLDFDTLLHVQHVSQVQQAQPHWDTFVAISVSIAAILGVHLHLRPYLRKIYCSPAKQTHCIITRPRAATTNTRTIRRELKAIHIPFKQSDLYNIGRTSSGDNHESCLQLLMSLHFPQTAKTAMDLTRNLSSCQRTTKLTHYHTTDECPNIICEMFFTCFICKRYCLLIIVLILYVWVFIFPSYFWYCITHVYYFICPGTPFVTSITLIVSVRLFRIGMKFSSQTYFRSG